MQWDERMTHIVLELLSHCTSQICIATNILKAAEILYPHTNIVKELLIISFLRGSRSALSFYTKLLEAYQMGKVDKLLENHYDYTQRCQISLQKIYYQDFYKGWFQDSEILSCNPL